MADPKQDPFPPPDAPARPDGPRQPIDLTVALEDSRGETARLPLSAYRALQPMIEAQWMKARFLENASPGEPVLHSYALPLADFQRANPAFDPTRVKAIRFIFDQTPYGSLILDDVGFRR